MPAAARRRGTHTVSLAAEPATHHRHRPAPALRACCTLATQVARAPHSARFVRFCTRWVCSVPTVRVAVRDHRGGEATPRRARVRALPPPLPCRHLSPAPPPPGSVPPLAAPAAATNSPCVRERPDAEHRARVRPRARHAHTRTRCGDRARGSDDTGNAVQRLTSANMVAFLTQRESFSANLFSSLTNTVGP